jgi:hypothetical protein
MGLNNDVNQSQYRAMTEVQAAMETQTAGESQNAMDARTCSEPQTAKVHLVQRNLKEAIVLQWMS